MLSTTSMHQKIASSFVLLMLVTFPTFAQQTECTPDPLASSDTLDDGNVRARIFNHGGLFWSGGQNVYEVPKGSGINSIFAASIWIAGVVDNELRGAASTYGPYEFWPGPLDQNGLPSDECSQYDRIWNVRQSDIDAYDASGSLTQDLAEWPWDLGAPVTDGDGDPNNYNLPGGDRPHITGTQALWWIMNDRGGPHEWTGTEPIGLEIHATAFAFKNAFHPFLNDATFYKYRIINKNTAPLVDTRFGLFIDADMGNPADDYVGSDSLLQLGYFYNGDREDENGYGLTPPAVGATLLISPRATPDQRDNDLDGLVDEYGEQISARYIINPGKGGGVTGDATGLQDIWAYMNGRWLDQTPFIEGGEGYQWPDWPENFPAQSARFAYPGDPTIPGYWTELKPFPDSLSSSPNAPADRRIMIASGPYTHAPMDTLEFVYAIMWSRGSDYLDSVRQLKEDTFRMRLAATDLLDLTEPVETSNEPLASNHTIELEQFPNPFSTYTTLQYELPNTQSARLAIYDLLGREIEVLTEGIQSAGMHSTQFNGSRLPPGIYYARLETPAFHLTKKLILIH